MIPLLESMLGEIVPARTWFGILMSVIGISMLECSGSPPNVRLIKTPWPFNFMQVVMSNIYI